MANLGKLHADGNPGCDARPAHHLNMGPGISSLRGSELKTQPQHPRIPPIFLLDLRGRKGPLGSGSLQYVCWWF